MSIQPFLQNKVAVITGASRGIGKATALMLAEAGASVVLAARSEESITKLADTIKATGGNAIAIATDVAHQPDVDLLLTMTIRAFKQVDILVNNAGLLSPIGKTWEVHPNAWQNLIKTNVIGPYLCARAVLPQMLDRGDGRIINVSSGAANANIEGWSAYCASKAALDRFTGVLAAEVAHTNIAVTAFNPGTTDTDMQAEIRDVGESAFPRRDYFRQLHSEDRLFRPDEPAQLILWLASEFGKNQNGAILDLGDEALRQQMAQDLGLPLIPNRKA